MLAIRLRRAGKTHFAAYRIVVQEAQKQPTSGKVVAYVGSFNPHSKEVNLDKDVAAKYLSNGAQPTPRVAKILKSGGVKLPSWVAEFKNDSAKKTRNPEKLRKNQSKDAAKTGAAEVSDTVAPTDEAAESAEIEVEKSPETAETSPESAETEKSAKTGTESESAETETPAEAK